jgi:hypothetical protein
MAQASSSSHCGGLDASVLWQLGQSCIVDGKADVERAMAALACTCRAARESVGLLLKRHVDAGRARAFQEHAIRAYLRHLASIRESRVDDGGCDEHRVTIDYGDGSCWIEIDRSHVPQLVLALQEDSQDDFTLDFTTAVVGVWTKRMLPGRTAGPTSNLVSTHTSFYYVDDCNKFVDHFVDGAMCIVRTALLAATAGAAPTVRVKGPCSDDAGERIAKGVAKGFGSLGSPPLLDTDETATEW